MSLMSTMDESTKNLYRLPAVDPYPALEEIKLQIGNLESGSQVELNISSVPVLESILLGQILRTCLACTDRGIKFTLSGVNAHSRWVIHNANLDTVFGLPKFEPPRWDSEVTSF